MKMRRRQGFTLIELMVTMAVAAVLLGFALPAFNGFTAQRRVTTAVNDFVLALNYARSEAARLGGRVTVQAINPADDSNEWGPGFCVVQGDPGDCTGTTLRVFDGYDSGTLDGTGALNTVNAFGFNSRGLMIAGAVGDLLLCATDAEVDPGRRISITAIGRANVADLVCNP